MLFRSALARNISAHVMKFSRGMPWRVSFSWNRALKNNLYIHHGPTCNHNGCTCHNSCNAGCSLLQPQCSQVIAHDLQALYELGLAPAQAMLYAEAAPSLFGNVCSWVHNEQPRILLLVYNCIDFILLMNRMHTLLLTRRHVFLPVDNIPDPAQPFRVLVRQPPKQVPTLAAELVGDDFRGTEQIGRAHV